MSARGWEASGGDRGDPHRPSTRPAPLPSLLPPSVIVGQPLDTVRVRQQAACPATAGASALATARALVAARGRRALFRGALYPAATIGLQSAVVFEAYGVACRGLAGGGEGADSGAPLPLSRVAAAGFFAGAVQLAVTIPVDLLKIRAQLDAGLRPPSPAAALRAALAEGRGVRALYRGAAITAARDVPSHGVYFAVYEWARGALDPGARERGAGAASRVALLAAGGVAGAASWASIYPLDVIKTRVQAAAAGGGVSAWAAAVAAARRGGLWAGAGPTLARAFVVNGVLFSVYEEALVALGGSDPADAAAGWGGA